MGRVQRKYSSTGCYHIMLRGNERKKIFLDNQDRQRFIDTLEKKKLETDLSIYAYCLMDNHVHLVVWDKKNEISLIMQGIATSYALFINNKYGRVGHVFQNRFKSEAIEDDRYLITVIRYVHNNPIKAFLVARPEQYQWSSYRNYISPNNTEAKLVDTAFILKMFAENQDEAIRDFESFSLEKDNSHVMDEDERAVRSFKEGEKFLEEYMKENWPALSKEDIRNNKILRDEVITELLNNTGLSIIKIADLLEINRGIVERMRSKSSKKPC